MLVILNVAKNPTSDGITHYLVVPQEAVPRVAALQEAVQQPVPRVAALQEAPERSLNRRSAFPLAVPALGFGLFALLPGSSGSVGP